jgi:hypothetical protein
VNKQNDDRPYMFPSVAYLSYNLHIKHYLYKICFPHNKSNEHSPLVSPHGQEFVWCSALRQHFPILLPTSLKHGTAPCTYYCCKNDLLTEKCLITVFLHTNFYFKSHVLCKYNSYNTVLSTTKWLELMYCSSRSQYSSLRKTKS